MPRLLIDDATHSLTGEVILGRHRTCGIQVKDDRASRQHAKVYRQDGLWWVEDLGSANGTRLNDKPIEGRKRLRDGDVIQIGTSRTTFAESDGEADLGVSLAPRSAASSTQDLSGFSGRDVAGYRIGKLIGTGMMGTVYQAQQLNLDRPVAFKVFDPERCVRDKQLAKRFLAEAGKVGSLTHDTLVQVHESGEHDGVLWCSLEWVQGESLQALMKRDGRVDPAMALLIAERIAEALSYAHGKGVIHGDIRPSHVFICPDGRIKLTDVGMMGIFEEGDLPPDGPADVAWYLSPEVASEGSSDPRTDIYSLGCMIYHMLTGKPPFNGGNTSEVVAAHGAAVIPKLGAGGLKYPASLDIGSLERILHAMMAKNPSWRHGTMDEVLADLLPIRKALGQVVAPASGQSRPLRRSDSVERGSTRTDARTEGRPDSKPKTRGEQKLYQAITWSLAVILGIVLIALLLPYIGRSGAQTTTDDRSDVPTVEVRPTTRAGDGDVSPAATAATVSTTTTPPRPATASKATAVRWADIQAQVDGAAAADDWSTAEQTLAAFAAEPEVAAEPPIQRQVTARMQQLTADGDLWYQQAAAAVPTGTTAQDLAARMKAFDGIRDRVLSENRPDAESRYQEALTKLGQLLNAAKRQARQAVEGGKATDLPAIATGLAPAFAGTPVAELHRQFALLCSEASGIKPLWAGTWAATKPKLLATKGANALAAAAALLLTSNTAEAKALLANDPTLASGDLLRRREALVGRKAAVLSFDDPDDLQFIDVFNGDPRMSGGALTGTAGEPVGLTCAAPLGTSGWDASLSFNLALAQSEGQAVISLVSGNDLVAQVRFEKDSVDVRVKTVDGWQEVHQAKPNEPLLRVRLAERAGSVNVLLNDQKLLTTTAKPAIPKGSRLRFEASGMVWSISDLQVVGGD